MIVEKETNVAWYVGEQLLSATEVCALLSICLCKLITQGEAPAEHKPQLLLWLKVKRKSAVSPDAKGPSMNRGPAISTEDWGWPRVLWSLSEMSGNTYSSSCCCELLIRFVSNKTEADDTRLVVLKALKNTFECLFSEIVTRILKIPHKPCCERFHERRLFLSPS